MDAVSDLHAGAEGADLNDDAVLIDGNDPGCRAPDRETFVREVGGELIELLGYRLTGVSHVSPRLPCAAFFERDGRRGVFGVQTRLGATLPRCERT